MRVLNDNSEQGTQTPEPVNLLSLPFYALLCALGFSSVVMSPLAVILAHRRLPDFWPKVVSILGAVIALLFLNVPVTAVLLSFVLGVFVADKIKRPVPVWNLLGSSVLLSAVLGILGVFLVDQMGERMGVLQLWNTWVSKGVQQAQEGGLISQPVDWGQIKQALYYQGPFYFLSGCLLSVWLSIGLGAHLRWQADEDPYSAKNLRQLRIHWSWSLVAILVWASTFVVTSVSSKLLLAGVLNLVMMVLFVQGTVLVALFLDQKKWNHMVRTLVYLLFIVVGFYALVGLGFMSPLILIKKKRPDLLPTKSLEEPV